MYETRQRKKIRKLLARRFRSNRKILVSFSYPFFPHPNTRHTSFIRFTRLANITHFLNLWLNQRRLTPTIKSEGKNLRHFGIASIRLLCRGFNFIFEISSIQIKSADGFAALVPKAHRI